MAVRVVQDVQRNVALNVVHLARTLVWELVNQTVEIPVNLNVLVVVNPLQHQW